MRQQKVLPSHIKGLYEKELHVGSSAIIIQLQYTTIQISPLALKNCIFAKMNYVTVDQMHEIEYDTLLYINDRLTEGE